MGLRSGIFDKDRYYMDGNGRVSEEERRLADHVAKSSGLT